MRFSNLDLSKSNASSVSILVTTIRLHFSNISGYLSGLSSPSGTESSIILRCAPVSNSAGHTRLPIFSSTIRSQSSKFACASASLTISASMWQSPPLWICTLSMPAPSAIRRASTSVSISTSIATTLSLFFRFLSNAVSKVVFPLPGDDITLSKNVPLFASDALIESAVLSLFENMLSFTDITLISNPLSTCCTRRRYSPRKRLFPLPYERTLQRFLRLDLRRLYTLCIFRRRNRNTLPYPTS